MHQLFFYFQICFLLLSVPFLEGKSLIKETKEISHAFRNIEEDTLLVFDLDNTLIEAAQHLGSEQWFSHHVEHLTKQGMHCDEALNLVLNRLIEVQKRSEMVLLDPSIPKLLKNTQKKQVAMVALTKRNPRMAERTLEQLAKLHIDFRPTAPLKKTLVLEELKGTTFKEGIIFVGNAIEKGAALMAYLGQLKRLPKKVVIVDDKLSHIQNVIHALEPLGIEVIGIRYGAADEKVKAFNPKIADFQWEHFQKILSDEQALHLLQLANQPASIAK